MSVIVISSPVWGPGPALFMALPSGTWRVAASLTSTTDVAVLGPVSGVTLTVAARISGEVAAVYLGQLPQMQLNARIAVNAAGVLTGETTALTIFGQGASLVNDGRITADGTAVQHSAVGGGEGRLVNRGDIAGAFGIARASASDSEALQIQNAGRLSGTVAAYDGGSAIARDVLLNRGEIAGAVRLGGGDDLYDGRGGRANGLIDGGAGEDVFLPGMGAERLRGGTGFDWIQGTGAGGLTLALDGSFQGVGATAGDSVTGIEGLRGTDAGADRLAGRAGDEVLLGLGSNDWLAGRSGADHLDGGGGADTLDGGDGADTLQPGAGDDVVRGGLGIDLLSYAGASGAVTVDLSTGRATGAGNDSLWGIEAVVGSGLADSLTGASGSNALAGGDGADTIDGGAGADTLEGQAGHDWLAGGAGADTVWGGAGADWFVLDPALPGADRVEDWEAGDKILLVVPDLPDGALDPAMFVASFAGVATDARDRVLWRASDRSLWFDADGTDVTASVLLATFGAGVTLNANDILIA